MPANKCTVKLFGRVSGSDKWVCLGDIEYEIVINGEIPDAYVYERNEKNVVININPASNGKEYLYRLVVMTEDEEILYDTKAFIQAENGSITIEAPKEKCLINVYQRESLEVPVEESYATIEVYEFSNTVGLDLTVDDSGFHVSGITSNTTEIALKNRDNTSLNIVVKDIDAGNGGTIDIPFEDVPSLESGLFYVYSPNGGVVSNNVKTRTSVSIFSTTPNYRSVDLEINFSSLIDVSSIIFSASDFIGTYNVDVVSVDSDNKTIISITDLDSNTKYEANRITLGVTDVDVSVPEFTTKSFAGITFEWNGTLIPGGLDVYGGPKKTNFVISVENSVEGSNSPYYVYFNDFDDFIKTNDLVGNKIRIMPLADSSVTNDIEISKINDAYKYNSKKWNSSGITPASWKISDIDFSKDSVLTITSSDSGIPFIGMVDTATTFEFNETRNESNIAIPYVKFKNTGYGKWGETVTLGLYSNEAYKTEYIDFESSLDPDAEYCWYLVPVNLTEGGAE